MSSKAKRMLKDLFEIFLKEPDTLPSPWRMDATQATEAKRARIVCDYIAGMTDGFAMDEYRRLYDPEALR